MGFHLVIIWITSLDCHIASYKKTNNKKIKCDKLYIIIQIKIIAMSYGLLKV